MSSVLRIAPAAAPTSPASDPATQLLLFNDALLAQAEALSRAFCEHRVPTGVPYAERVGPHLRHVIEHYEALLQRRAASELEYDARQRDALLESSAALAMQRIGALRQALRALASDDIEAALFVHTRGGLQGQWPLATLSTVARELVFLASHTVHHFALLRGHCEAHGITLPAHFGVAPATVAHALAAH